MVRGDPGHKLETEVAEPREHQASQEHGLVLAKSNKSGSKLHFNVQERTHLSAIHPATGFAKFPIIGRAEE